MANKFKGEVPLQCGDATYTLRFSANAIAELEGELNMGINKIAAGMIDPETFRMQTLITVIWCGLHGNHPDITKAQAGEIITDLTLVRSLEAVNQAFVLAFGKPSSEETAEVPPKPGKIPAKHNNGIGKAS